MRIAITSLLFSIQIVHPLFLRRFCRLTLAFSKKLQNLKAAVSLYVAHHNWRRTHRTLRMTPAMKAGLARHPWTMEELLLAAGGG